MCLYRRDIRLVPESRDFRPFDPKKIDEYANVPEETLLYYKEKFLKGERPLFFHHVPHILYKGTIEIEGLAVIEL